MGTVKGDTALEPGQYVVVSYANPVGAGRGDYWGLGFAGIANDD